jgi:hypothetical protein
VGCHGYVGDLYVAATFYQLDLELRGYAQGPQCSCTAVL